MTKTPLPDSVRIGRVSFGSFSPQSDKLPLAIDRLSSKMTIFAHGYIIFSQKQR